MRSLLTLFEYLFYLFGVVLAFLIFLVIIALYPITLGKSKQWAEHWFSKGLDKDR